MYCWSEVGKSNATGTAVRAFALSYHLPADLEQLGDVVEPFLTVAQAAWVSIVEDQRALAQVLAVHHSADISAITHGDHRQRYDG